MIQSMFEKIKRLRQPGVEPGSAAWKATMITATPLTLISVSSIKTVAFLTSKFDHLTEFIITSNIKQGRV